MRSWCDLVAVLLFMQTLSDTKLQGHCRENYCHTSVVNNQQTDRLSGRWFLCTVILFKKLLDYEILS